jgi:hypothetical protein
MTFSDGLAVAVVVGECEGAAAVESVAAVFAGWWWWY